MKIGFTGAQSTGKTTLLNALKSEKFFKEFDFCEGVTRWVNKLGININENGDDLTQEIILMKHVYNLYTHDNMIADRTIIDVLVYSIWMHDNGKISEDTYLEVVKVFEKAIKEYDYIFFIEPEFEITDDGVRSSDKKFQDEINEIFKNVLSSRNINYTKITGSVRQRVGQVLDTLGYKD